MTNQLVDYDAVAVCRLSLTVKHLGMKKLSQTLQCIQHAKHAGMGTCINITIIICQYISICMQVFFHNYSFSVFGNAILHWKIIAVEIQGRIEGLSLAAGIALQPSQ